MICPLSPAFFVALGSLQLSLMLLAYKPVLAPVPLLICGLFSLIAPLFPALSYYLPIISRGRRDSGAVALTFDDGPDPEVTPRVLELLARYDIKATFFVTGRNAERYPELINGILAQGHSIGNHSYNHSPLLMLKGARTLRYEIETTQKILQGFGITPVAFRPPVGATNPRLWRILLEQGMYCLNFSRRAGDLGNRRVNGLAARILRNVVPGDIILLHDVLPRVGNTSLLLQEFETVCKGLFEKGMKIVPLAGITGKEVMTHSMIHGGSHPAALFYDGLAETYDQEQFCSGVSISRTRELELFRARAEEIFHGATRVLEIGAGTGIFTREIARLCTEIVAVDISANMLALLQQKADENGLKNVRTLVADVESAELSGEFSTVCAFSSLEYLKDLQALLQKLYPWVAPGGHLYFITARRSLFRFFTQIGNAMRQGIWLKAHSSREITNKLRAAGFEPVSVSSHLLRCPISGGMLLEVVARKPRGDNG
jgi:peptidoglycan/xylan/chitin deacetylase (PgdA/CDA1 family)/ubiquinone/menaquinone biosynthesis C-methylase UbiE